MGHFRFKKSIKLAPWLKLNFNKNSTSVTFGRKGAHYTVNSNGTETASLGFPGTGISYADVKRLNKTPNYSPSYQNDKYLFDSQNMEPDYNFSGDDFDDGGKTPNVRFYQKTWFIVLMLFFVSPVGLFLMWYFKEWNAPVKALISVFFIFYFMIYCALLFT